MPCTSRSELLLAVIRLRAHERAYSKRYHSPITVAGLYWQEKRMTRARRPPRHLVLSWIALLALLGATVFIAYLPLGIANTVITMTIAGLNVQSLRPSSWSCASAIR